MKQRYKADRSKREAIKTFKVNEVHYRSPAKRRINYLNTLAQIKVNI